MQHARCADLATLFLGSLARQTASKDGIERCRRRHSPNGRADTKSHWSRNREMCVMEGCKHRGAPKSKGESLMEGEKRWTVHCRHPVNRSGSARYHWERLGSVRKGGVAKRRYGSGHCPRSRTLCTDSERSRTHCTDSDCAISAARTLSL